MLEAKPTPERGPGTGSWRLSGQPLSAIAAITTAAARQSELMAAPSCHRCAQR